METKKRMEWDGSKLKSARLKMNLSVEKLCYALMAADESITRNTLVKYERGFAPSFNLVLTLSFILNTPISEFQKEA